MSFYLLPVHVRYSPNVLLIDFYDIPVMLFCMRLKNKLCACQKR